jgi:hypothetical protein
VLGAGVLGLLRVIGHGPHLPAERCSGRAPFDVVWPDAVENIGIPLNGKREAVALGDAGFPDIAALGVTFTFHLFGSQRRVAEVHQKKSERPISSSLKALRKSLIIFCKRLGGVGWSFIAERVLAL